MVNYLILALVVLAGCGQPVQVAANARLRDSVRSPALAALLSFLVGSAVLGALALFGVPGGRGQWRAVLDTPWWAWVGGLSGAFSVFIAIVALRRSGEATVIAFTIVGQLTLSIVIDHFGWLNVPQRSLSASRVVGAVLLVVGAFLIHRK